MPTTIQDLWEKQSLPIKEGIHFGDGRFFPCKISYYPEPKIEKGNDFECSHLPAENSDDISFIDVLKEIALSDGGYLCVGEGSYGSEGFIASLNKARALQWVIYAEESNPFIDIIEEAPGIIVAESSAGFKLRINTIKPTDFSIFN